MEVQEKDIEISVVSPVYQADSIVVELVRRLIVSLETTGETFEILLIDDHSPDSSWEAIVVESKQDSRVKGIRLSRNEGQHRAIRAGLDASAGKFVVVIDCDLQDDPKYIPALLQAARDGSKIVYTSKVGRSHSRFRNFSAWLYFGVLRLVNPSLAAIEQLKIGSFSILSRQVVDEYLKIGDIHSQYLMNLRSLGFSSSVVEVEHTSRHSGKSGYSLRKLLNLAVDGIVGESVRILNASIAFGTLLFLVSFGWSVILLVGYFQRGAAAGYTSLMVALLLMTGILLISIGILGLYIGKIFEQVKSRALYSVESRTPIRTADDN
jgi:polyisoprenyl-phosphate glycosyltransferase